MQQKPLASRVWELMQTVLETNKHYFNVTAAVCWYLSTGLTKRTGKNCMLNILSDFFFNMDGF